MNRIGPRETWGLFHEEVNMYCMNYTFKDVIIPLDKQALAYHKLVDIAEGRQGPQPKEGMDLGEILYECFGLESEYERFPAGDLRLTYWTEGGLGGDEDWFLKNLAPYLKDGGCIEFSGEDGDPDSMGRYTFRSGKMVPHQASVRYTETE